MNKKTMVLSGVLIALVAAGTAEITGFTLLDESTTQTDVEEPFTVNQVNGLAESVDPGVVYANGEENPQYTVTNDGPVAYTMAVKVEVTEQEKEDYLANLGLALETDGEGTAYGWLDHEPSREVVSYDTDGSTYVEMKQTIQPGQTFDVYAEFETASDAPSNTDALDFDVQVARE